MDSEAGHEMPSGTLAYGPVAKVLHWVVAGAVVLQFVLANLADDAESRFREFVLLANHKSVGISILAVALLRIGWRFAVPPPPPVPMPAWQRIASGLSHSALYLLIILMPLTGWLMSSASNVPVSWFNLFQLPDFVQPNETLADLFEESHETIAAILFVLACIHVAAALKHWFVDRNAAVSRMTSPVSITLFLVIVIAGILWLIPASRAEDEPASWDIDYDASAIRFVAEQAGATFEGRWSTWNADLRFDGSRPDGSFDVEVRVSGVVTGDADRDETLADPEFFDATRYPVVRYRASSFRRRPEGGYIADGRLIVKGTPHDVPLEFDVTVDGDRRTLVGSARVDRLALGIGTGEWSDTAWIGQFVDINVTVQGRIAD